MSWLMQHYHEEARPALRKTLGCKSVMQVPRLLKVTLNMGVGEATTDKQVLQHAIADLTRIAGQRCVATQARKPIANFKIREGWYVGCKVTLRHRKMYEFLERLTAVALPRIRDFRGIARKSLDGRGNLSFGVREQIIFPEIDYDKIDCIRGLDVCITTSAFTDEQAYQLFKAIRFPVR